LEKFEIYIKWGSYLFITNVAASIVISLLILLVDYNSLRYLSNILILVFIVQLIYFTTKALKENKKYGLSKGFRKFFVFTRIIGVYFLFFGVIEESRLHSSNSFISHPFIKEDLPELFIKDESNEYRGITLNEFIATLKRKFSRP